MENNRNLDVGIYFVAKLGPALLGFASIFLISRALSPESYGKYSLVLTSVLLATQIMGAWFNQAQFYFLPKRLGKPDGMKEWFGRANAYIAFVGAMILAAILYVLDVGAIAALIAGAIYFAQIYWNYLSTYFQSLEKPKTQLSATFYQVATQMAIILTLHFFQRITIASALCAVFCGFFASVVHFVQQRAAVVGKKRFVVGRKRQPFFRYFKLAIGYGGPFSLWFLFCQIYTLSDRFLLNGAGLYAEVGRYSASRDLLLGVASMFAMPLLMVAHPMIMRIWSERRAVREIEQIINRNLMIIYSVGVLFCTMLYAYGTTVFGLVFSPEYRLHNYEYAMIGCAIFFSVASMYAHKALEVTGATMKMACLGGGVALFSVVANLLVVHKGGLPFVIFVSAISQIGYFAGAARLSRVLWRVGIPVRRALEVLLMAVGIYFLSHLVDVYFPEPMSRSLHLPWGLLAGLILSMIALFRVQEVSSMIVQVRGLKGAPLRAD